MNRQDHEKWPDLAARNCGGSVIAASDESFAEKEALIRPGRPVFSPKTFGGKGQVYDGWETRRRRTPGHDWAVVRLGMPGVIHGVIIDTAWFKGNFPPYASVEACAVDGHPTADELTGWVEIVPRSLLSGDAHHHFGVSDERRFTHVRLNIYPDGGVARLRVHGDVIPDPAYLSGLTIDLAALENGGLVTACSDEFYSAPNNVIASGEARNQAEGWETARRRDDGNDWLVVRLAGAGRIQVAELDTRNLVHNAPGWAALTGIEADGGEFALLDKTRLHPDTRHRFRLDSDREAVAVRLDIYPDGGLARLRLLGTLTPEAVQKINTRW
ncbi:allantoicase [Streptosporangiaceae bacterium NEAU-GS5]|nr:allantoicase [Streptosporangiaceae bacterium NEAU-GS5]